MSKVGSLVEFKQKCLSYLGGKKCYRCGCFDLPVCCYDFHHVVGNKEFGLSGARHREGKFVEIELDKCVVLCSNCHRVVHYLKEVIVK